MFLEHLKDLAVSVAALFESSICARQQRNQVTLFKLIRRADLLLFRRKTMRRNHRSSRQLGPTSLDTILDKVEFLLIRFPRARNNDGYLLLLYWKHYLGIPVPPLTWKQILMISCFDSVRRMRQKLQADEPENYGPTDPIVAYRRRRKESNMRDWLQKER